MRYPISQAGNANGRFRTRKEVCEGPLLCCSTGGNGSIAAVVDVVEIVVSPSCLRFSSDVE
jgi:hypothetical protein